MPLAALAGASSPFEVGIRFPHCLIRPYATSVFLRPMRSHAGEAAAFRQKRNGNLPQMAVRFTETCLTPEGYIPQSRPAMALTNSSATAGSGRQPLGSSIGNFSPREARTILRNLRSELRAGDALLLGTDMIKDEATLVRAYDDRDGVTAAFNLNVLHRLNRELGANFNTDCFRHRARWNRAESRMEMHLESAHDQSVDIPAAELSVQFAAFETIHTESSYKFTRKTLGALLDDAGFTIKQTWTDPRQWYTLTLAGLR